MRPRCSGQAFASTMFGAGCCARLWFFFRGLILHLRHFGLHDLPIPDFSRRKQHQAPPRAALVSTGAGRADSRPTCGLNMGPWPVSTVSLLHTTSLAGAIIGQIGTPPLRHSISLLSIPEIQMRYTLRFFRGGCGAGTFGCAGSESRGAGTRAGGCICRKSSSNSSKGSAGMRKSNWKP